LGGHSAGVPLTGPSFPARSSFSCCLRSVYGPLIAPHDLYFSRALYQGQAPPFDASGEYPFGSDIVGRDRLSWLLIGARGSVLIALAATGLRVLVGGSLGLLAGFQGGRLAQVLHAIALGVSSMPATIATLLAVIALGLEFGQFVVALGLIGWAEPFHQTRRYARAESARPFMETARSVGLGRSRLLTHHLLPNVAPQLLTTAAFQFSAVLLLTGELALLNIFVGGAVLIDYDSRGSPIVAPRVPNWASMLAATRPIVSLYGDLASVLLPGSALLGAVLATNVFGDALAARAQRLDVYRLFTCRQLVGGLALALVVALSVMVWPSHLQREISYARGFDTGSASALATELAALGPRPNASPEARAAATLLAQRMRGEIIRGTDETIQAHGVLTISGTPLSVEALSLMDADAEGALVLVDTVALQSGQVPDAVRDAVVAVGRPAGPGPQRIPDPKRFADAGARALIVLDTPFLAPTPSYPLPVVRMSQAALVAARGRPLPDLRASGLRAQQIAGDVRLSISVELVRAEIADVVARVSAPTPGAPIVVIAARYDGAPDATARWDTASAAALLVAVVEHLRENPLPLEVIAMATAGDHQSFAGLRLGLAQLQQTERDRVQSVLVIGPLLADHVRVETQLVQGLPSGSGRLAARLSDALGVEVVAAPLGELARSLVVARVNVTPLSVSSAGADRAPTANDFEAAAQVVLTALAYVPNHLSEMR